MEYDDQPLDLSLPKKKDTMMSIRTGSFFNDIEALVVPKRKKYPFRTTNLEDPKALERRFAESGNDSNLVLFVEDADSPSGSIDMKMGENIALPAAVVCKSESDDDDNCSITSEISLFASDSETIYSPGRKNPAAGWSLEKYRVLDEQVEQILAMTIKKSPKMVSPISDSIWKKFRNGRKLESSIIETKSADLGDATGAPWENILELTTKIDTTEAKQSLRTAEPNGVAYLGYAAEHPIHEKWPFQETTKLNQFEAPTIIDTTHPLNGMQYKSKIDFKNLERIAINVGDANSSRFLSSAQVMTHPQSSLTAVPVACTVSVQSAAQRYEQPSNILPVPQPMDSVLNVVQRQSAVPAATPTLEPFLKQPLTTQPFVTEQPNNSIKGHFNTGKPDDSLMRRYFRTTLNIFEYPCINYLDNKPCAVPFGCPYSHQLPNCDTILQQMHNIPVDLIDFIYKEFIAQYRPTFEQYFPWICRLLGMRQMQETLIASVKDCDKYQKYDFYKFIFGGLLLCGNKDAEAIDKMVDIVDVGPRIENQMLALVEIMNSPGNPYS